MDNQFVKIHGMTLANNSWIENVVIERLETDPFPLEVGRVWYNKTEKTFKAAYSDGLTGTVTKTFSTYDELNDFIELLKSSLGTNQIGFNGYSSNTGTFAVPSGSLTDTLENIIEKVSTLELGGGSGVSVVDEGMQVLKVTKNVNFVGNDVLAVQSGPEEVTVYVPAPDFAPMYNNEEAIISNISTTQRKIANNTGALFSIGNWAAGSSQPSTKTSAWIYNSPVKVGINDKTTTFTVQVFGSDDTTIIAQHTITNIDENTTSSSANGITISVSGWETDYFRYKAYINVSLDLLTIIPNGGRFSVKMEHNNSILGKYSKSQGPVFFDPDTVESRPSIGSFDITENTAVIKSLSGIKYYNLNSTFNINVNDIDNINKITWPNDNNVIRINSNTNFGISDYYLTSSSSDLTGWTNEWNVNNLSSTKVKSLTRSSFRFIGTDAKISGNWIDWIAGATQNSPNKSILIDTYNTESTDQYEEFTDESRRLKEDLHTQWDSTELLNSNDLMIQGGVLKRQTGDWSSYSPTNNANYSAANSNEQYYYREFKDNTTHSNGLFYIGGITESNLSSGQVKIHISTNGTDWYDCSKDYTSGALSNNSGCRINKDTRALPYLEFTLGTGGSTDASTGTNGNGLWVRISMPAGSPVQLDYIRITNW